MFQMHNIAYQAASEFCSIPEYNLVCLFGCKCIDLFDPHPSQLSQRPRVPSQMYIVRLIHDPAHKGCNQYSAAPYKFLERLLHTFLHHIEYRSSHHLISAEICIRRNHIDCDIPVIEVLVILVDLFNISQIFGWPACIFQRPVVIPVKDDSNLCFIN